MRLAVVSTFSPSQLPAAGFGYRAVGRFLQDADIEQVVVLADEVDGAEVYQEQVRLRVVRCWRYNSLFSVLRIVRAIAHARPDVVWLNLQYTLFGSKLVPAFLGLLLTALIKKMDLPVVTLLHNYLAVVDRTKLGNPLPAYAQAAVLWADKLAMKSIMTADCILTMVPEYANHLRRTYPHRQVILVEQDLYELPPFQPLPRTSTIMTMGYYGTYKRLELLLEAFQELRRSIPQARLQIVGRSHPQTPTYLEDLVDQCAGQLTNVDFMGFVPECGLPSVFWTADIVAITNAVSTGSSAVLRYAAAYGRGLVMPLLDSYRDLKCDGWGVEFYRPEDARDLVDMLMKVLGNPNDAAGLAMQNYERARKEQDEFTRMHLRIFREVAPVRSRVVSVSDQQYHLHNKGMHTSGHAERCRLPEERRW